MTTEQSPLSDMPASEEVVRDYRLRLRADTREIEMHAFPQSEVFRIFREHGCVPLEVFEDGLSGHRDNHRSNSFLFRKISSEDFE